MITFLFYTIYSAK